jgi:chromosome segregation ATPase
MAGLAFIVAVVAVVLAVVFWFQGQSAAEAVKGLRQSADEARKEAETARAELRKQQEELKARSAQLQETREKLVEARKKAQDARGGKTQSRGAREAELEEDLAHARKLTEEAHAAESAARRDLQALRASEAQARAELAAAQAKLREAASRPAPAPVAAVVPVAPSSPDVDALRQQLEAAKSELERQVTAADKLAREAKRREQELREELKKFKGRAETNNRVYLVTKGELELMKERLAQAERKLWQAGIPLAPPASKERPKATGPAAAERSQAGGSQAADDTAPLEGASAEAAEAGEPIAAGEAQAPMQMHMGAENGLEEKKPI